MNRKSFRRLNLSRQLKSLYRQNKLSSFILVFGVADAVLGGFSQHWTLLSLGLFIATMGIITRSFPSQKRKNKNRIIYSPPRRYLPPSDYPLLPLPPLERKAKKSSSY